MKKITILSLLLFFTQILVAQSLNFDSILQNISTETDVDKKIELILAFHTPEYNNNPNLVIEIGLKLFKQSQVDKNNVEESAALSMLGHGYRLAGNNVKALEFHHKGLALAEKINNQSLLAMAENQIGHVYKDRGEYNKAIQFYLSASDHAEKGKCLAVRIWPLANLGSVFLLNNNLDSALIYSQRTFEYITKLKEKNLIFLAFINLASVHSKLGNALLAQAYFEMAKKEVEGTPYVRYQSILYTNMAEHYQRNNQPDSCIYYAKKCIKLLSNTPFFYLSNKSAQLLIDIYGTTNCDSTLAYTKVLKTANDSLTSNKANQQIMLMTFEEDLRQQEMAFEKTKEEQVRKENIQYALIAVGILLFLTLYLLLSRSFITNTKMIEYIGVIALLIVFEFLNLLLHPFLGKITNHNPLLMLLSLVGIAALLVPLHHKVEKWATGKLVEKNKKIRLAAAQKTIEELREN